MQRPASTWWILGAWILLVGSYAVVSLTVPAGTGRTTFGDVTQCLVPLFAISGLLLNTAAPDWRRNSFWMLLALGCFLWMVGQSLWTYIEVVQNRPVPNPFAGDIIFFLHTIPMIAAIALQPHERETGRGFGFGYVDFALLLFWWLFLYAFFVVPWQYVVPTDALYGHSYNVLLAVENLVLLTGVGVLCPRAQGRWRAIYGHLFVAAFLYNLASQTINVAIDLGKYSTGSYYDVPLVASFVAFGTAGITAYRQAPTEEALVSERPNDAVWRTRLAIAAVFSLPALGFWNISASAAPEAVRHFRLQLLLAGIVALTLLIFLRQNLVDRERVRLLRASQEAFGNLQHVQTQLVQSEKLASLGRLAAGAAHEINNPLAAILGYSELLMDHEKSDEKLRDMAQKIRDQARRTKSLVSNLLSFARQVPSEKAPVDINAALTSALQLRALDLHRQRIRIALEAAASLPLVRGDMNQLLQVFFNVLSNAVDALDEVGGGVITVRTRYEKTVVIVEMSDTGPGIREPHLVFDPFYTTKPAGKGTGLGLSICYGIVQEHGGKISCHNRPAGGATFRIELPALRSVFAEIPAALQRSGLSEAADGSGRSRPELEEQKVLQAGRELSK
jgi:signal transduction histidine kinase